MNPTPSPLRALVFLLGLGAVVLAEPIERPNIVFILSDDQDWTGLSTPMHPEVANSKSDFYRTPNLAACRS
jgi:hypothetical protein